MSEFKVGDNVCDPLRYGNGAVIKVDSFVHVLFERMIGGSGVMYSMDGFFSDDHLMAGLFHGHMEPGTGKVTFTPKKEPIYEWQWEAIDDGGDSDGRPRIYITEYYESESEMFAGCKGIKGLSDFIRIERSKREVKP